MAMLGNAAQYSTQEEEEEEEEEYKKYDESFINALLQALEFGCYIYDAIWIRKQKHKTNK